MMADEKTRKDLLIFYDLVCCYIKQVKAEKEEDNNITFATFVEIYGKLVVNGFEITDDITKETIGWGIYLLPSIIDHSCQPNAMVLYQGGKNLSVISLMDISISSEYLDFSKHIQISYIDCLEPTEERRKLLKEQYFFECFCVKCEKSLNSFGSTDIDSVRSLLQCTEL